MPKGAGKVDQQRGKGVVGEGAKDSGEAPGRRIAARRHSFFGVSLSVSPGANVAGSGAGCQRGQ